jgi:hypothetical protein
VLKRWPPVLSLSRGTVAAGQSDIHG